METLMQDIRYALRTLRRSPGFTAATVLTLALGIGATSAIFTVLHRAVLRALPVAEPGRLVHVVTDRGPDGINYNLSYPAFDALRRRATVFTVVAAHTPIAVAVGLPEGAERVEGAAVSRGFFAAIGAPIAQGRDFLAEEDAVGGPPSVVLGQALWRRRFASRPDILGSAITLNGTPFTVVGIAPRGFTGPVTGRAEELFVPLGSIGRVAWYGDLTTNPRASWLDVFARLASDVTRERAQAGVALLDAQAVAAGERPAASRTLLRDASRGFNFAVGWITWPLVLLMTVVGLVLLLACANIANLLLARAGARRREVAVRLALGAGRGRLVRQLLTESAVLAVAGAAAGLLVARWGMDLLLGYQPPGGGQLELPRGLDPVALGFTALVTLLTGIGFGLVPALRASRPEVVPALKGAEPRWHERLFGLRGTLVVVQVAISLVLVVGAALFLRSIANLRAVELGYAPGDVLLASVDLQQAGYDRARGTAFTAELLERLGAVPGVSVASAAQVITPNPGGSNWSGVALEGYTPAPGEEVSFDANKVAPRYFEALGIRLVRGRGIELRDVAGAPLVAVVNETFASRYYGAGGALGRRILLGEGPTARSIEIVGVATDGRYRDLRERGTANVYFPLAQSYASEVTLILRTRGDPLALAGVARREVQALDASLPLFAVRSLRQHVAAATAQDRMLATLSTAFGVVALLLAALGLFSVIAYGVTQRTREIGVRMALGARRADVIGMVVGRSAALVGVGLAIGLVAALGLGRLAAGLLFGVAPADPASLAAAVAVLGGAAAVAAYLPARRAARIDPMAALRSE